MDTDKHRWKMGKIGVVAMLAFCAFAVAAKQPDFSKATAILEQGIKDGAYPGCTIVVGNEDKIIWSQAFGHMEYSDKEPVTKETMYDLASLTKVTGTTSVYMRLVQLGKIGIHDLVGKYMPEYVDLAPESEKEKRKAVTIENLLTHTSGFPSGRPLYKTANSYQEIILAACKVPLETDPGTKFTYSDLNLILAGEIASRVGGKPLWELERELVFDPLGMKDTMRNPPASLIPRIAPTEFKVGTETPWRGTVHDENSRGAGGITGHAGLFSSGESLAKLATELLRALDGKGKLMSQAVVADFVRPHVIGQNSDRGLGWGFTEHQNYETRHADKRPIYHTGFTGTSIEIDPVRKIYVILLTNRVYPTRDNSKVQEVRHRLPEAVLRALDKAAK